MGYLYELLATPYAFAKKTFYQANPVKRSKGRIFIPFGTKSQQHCCLWEPDEVTHDEAVIYFHGGGYVFGTPESLIDLANVYNSQGYRFCSVGFRRVPFAKFPAQVDDAFRGAKAAIEWLERNGRPAQRVIVGGTSAGGHLACLLTYGRDLQKQYGFPAEHIVACVSIAGVGVADDMCLKPFPNYRAWQTCMDLPTDGTSRQAMREALLPYSPIELVDEQSTVPLFAMHGAADTLSPYESQVRFVNRLNEVAGQGTAHLLTLPDWRWQHMLLTVTLHKHAVDEFPPLRELFTWLDEKTSQAGRPAHDKESLRAYWLGVRSRIPETERAEADAGIAAQVHALPAYQQADAVFTYLDMGDEVRTRDIIEHAWAAGKTVALPRCIPGTRVMAWHRVSSFEGLVKSQFGVEEPADDPATRVNPADFAAPLALVPGLTFDARGFRMGYGGGFYDIFLAQFDGATVGLCRECQLSDEVAFLDAHDLPVQTVVTEKRVLQTR